MQTLTYLNNLVGRKNSQSPLHPSPVCRVIMILHYAAVVILHWPKWLLEMHACDQSVAACWSSQFPDIVHWPRAPTTDNGSLCQTGWGRISSRMFGCIMLDGSHEMVFPFSWKCSVETKWWKGIRYAECVIKTCVNHISFKIRLKKKKSPAVGDFVCSCVHYVCVVLKLLLN